MRHRKASLSLSINAIVVLILAITILGLGLGFIKKQFTGVTKNLEDVNKQLAEETRRKIVESGQLLVFEVLEWEATRGIEDTVYMGVSNTDTDERCYQFMLACRKSFGSNGCDGQGSTEAWIVGGIDAAPGGLTGYPDNDMPTDWFSLLPEVPVAAQSVGVFPVRLRIGGSIPGDTYFMELIVFKGDDNCDAVTSWQEFQKKQFYIKLK